MASFVIHSIIGEKFLEKMEQDVVLTELEKNSFRLGNLVVDVLGFGKTDIRDLDYEEVLQARREYRKKKIQKKLVTHFRDGNQCGVCMNCPRLDQFLFQYQDLVLQDFSAFGYFFHLYTDKVFFENFYSYVITCLDQNYQPTNLIKDNLYIRVNKNGKIYLKDEFWSGRNNIYDDYTKLNCYCIQKFGFPFFMEELEKFAHDGFINPGIQEVDYRDIDEVLGKMKQFLLESEVSTEEELMAFSFEKMEQFILKSADNFYFEYQAMIEEFISKKKRVKVRK